MAEAYFRFNYEQRDGSGVLDACDASQALYGMSRSVAIFTHYALHRQVIKQGPVLKGARVLIVPPVTGSFEFILPIVHALSDQSPQSSIALNLASNYIYDLGKIIYSRLTGKTEKPSSDQVSSLMREAPGDLDALSDTVEEDISRIHRPITYNTTVVNILGGANAIATFNRDTYDFAKTKIVGDQATEFFGHVTSLNGNTVQGRFWVEEEERSVGFSVDRSKMLKAPAKRILSWSLDQWVRQLEGWVYVKGYPLTSKQGLLKHIFLTDVRRA